MSGLIFIPRFAKTSAVPRGPVVQLFGGRRSMIARTEDNKLYITGGNTEYATSSGIARNYWKEAAGLWGTISDYSDDGDQNNNATGFMLASWPFIYACGHNPNRRLATSGTSTSTVTGGFLRAYQNSFRGVCLSKYASILYDRPNSSVAVMFGINTNMALHGTNDSSVYYNSIFSTPGSNTVTAMAMTPTGALALGYGGELWVRGDCDNYQLGANSPYNIGTLTRRTTILGRTITKIVAGAQHFLMLLDNGYVYAWGWNSYGQLGRGHTSSGGIERVSVPLAADISASPQGSVILTRDNEVYHFGRGFNGNTASSSGSNLTPFKMQVPEGEIEAAVATFAGIALLINGYIHVKGYNIQNSLGFSGNITEWTSGVPSQP